MTEPGQQQQTDQQFGVIAEVEGRQRQLVLLNLPFPRLIDEIIVPYDNDEAFLLMECRSPERRSDVLRS